MISCFRLWYHTPYHTSGGRFVHTFSKVCISLQSVHLAEKMHTFFYILQTFCRLYADFFWRFAHVLHTLNDVKSTFMHTFCRLSFFLIRSTYDIIGMIWSMISWSKPMISYESSGLWYHRYDMDHDIIVKPMIS